MTDQQRERIGQLASAVPQVWQAESTTAADRKELLNLLLDRVVLTRQAPRGAVEVTLHWKTGAQTRLVANLGRSHATDPQVVDRIRELAVDHTDGQIAARMDAEGWRTARGVDWTPRNVKNLRTAYHIREHCLAHPDGSAGPRGDGCYSVNEAGKMLGVSRGTVIDWIHRGLLDATRDDPKGAWWVALTEGDRERLTRPAGCEGMVPLAEAVKRLDRPRSTLRNWIRTGRLEGRRVQLGRRTVWYVALPETQDPTES